MGIDDSSKTIVHNVIGSTISLGMPGVLQPWNVIKSISTTIGIPIVFTVVLFIGFGVLYSIHHDLRTGTINNSTIVEHHLTLNAFLSIFSGLGFDLPLGVIIRGKIMVIHEPMIRRGLCLFLG